MITFFSTFGNRTIDKKLAELLGGLDQARPAASPAEADILVLVRRTKSAGVDDPLAWYDGAKPAVLVIGRPDPEGLALAEEAARRGVPPDLILLSPEGAASMPLADVAAAVRRALEGKGGGAPGEEQSGKDTLPPPVLEPAGDGALSGRAARRDVSPGEGGDVPAEPAGTPPRPAAGDVPDAQKGGEPPTAATPALPGKAVGPAKGAGEERTAPSAPPAPAARPPGSFGGVENGVEEMVVFSPWLPRVGVTLFAMEAAEVLSRRGRVALVDADFDKPGLGVRLGFPPADLAAADWRQGGGPVAVGGSLEAWLLDPGGTGRTGAAEIVRAALHRGAAAVVVDAGADPDAAVGALGSSGGIGVVVADLDPLAVLRFAKRWAEWREKVCFPVVAAAVGAGEAAAAEAAELLGAPCFPVRREEGGFALADVERVVEAAVSTAVAGAQSRAVYVLGWGVKGAGLVCFADPAALLAAVEGAVPEAVIVDARVPGTLETVKNLRRRASLSAAPVGVFGVSGPGYEWYAAGADACYEVLDAAALEDLLDRRVRAAAAAVAAEKDGLTGCLRREALAGLLAAQAARFFETRVPFSVLMLDLDHFKAVNDTYGHQAGDAVLAAFGEFLLRSVREVDRVVRYGGEEFLVVLPGAKAEQALEVGERLRAGWAAGEIRLSGGETLKSTLSGGAAEFGRHSLDAEALVAAADRALYRAKEAGRDKVEGA